MTYQQVEITNGERTKERVRFYRDTLDVMLPLLGHLLADAVTSEEAVAIKLKLGFSAEVYYKQVQLVRQVLQLFKLLEMTIHQHDLGAVWPCNVAATIPFAPNVCVQWLPRINAELEGRMKCAFLHP